MNDMVKITVETADETRTYINESAHRVEWSDNDRIVVFENNELGKSMGTTITNGKASFTVIFFRDNNSSSFTYNAIYPTTSFAGSDNVDLTNVELTLPSTQSASSTSFDPAADMLIAKPQTMDKQAESITMQFKRIVAMAKLSIKGLPWSTIIKEVTFTANNAKLTGTASVDLSKGEIQTIYNASESVTVKYENNIASTNPIYFNCYPTTLNAGDSFSVTVTTNTNSTYTKSVTIPAGRELRFEEGDLSTFTIDMSGVSEENPATTYKYEIGKMYDINGTNGVCYAIKTDKQGNNWAYFFSMDEADLQWSAENVWCNCISDKGSWNTYDPFDPLYSRADGGARDINDYPAFKWCMVHGDGWFMPSSTELQWMWDAISDDTHDFHSASVMVYNKLLTDNGGMPFVETYYWSSNETAEDSIEVIAFMHDSIICLEPLKNHTYTVRAVYRILLEE